MSTTTTCGTTLADWLPIIDTIINVVGMILIPIAIIYISKRIAEKEQNHTDKMNLFKVLMTYRDLGWSMETIHALNMIDIVFCDDTNVRGAWQAYYAVLCNPNPNAEEQLNIVNAQYHLLNEMATSLGYKEDIFWDAVQKPYVPQGMLNARSQQQQYQSGINQLMELFINHVQAIENKQSNVRQATNESGRNDHAHT